MELKIKEKGFLADKMVFVIYMIGLVIIKNYIFFRKLSFEEDIA